jgi:hypothetical protein
MNGPPAWIEIVVDDIVAELSVWPLANWQFARDGGVGPVLFHEIGHHLDSTIGAEARSGEPAADASARNNSSTNPSIRKANPQILKSSILKS